MVNMNRLDRIAAALRPKVSSPLLVTLEGYRRTYWRTVDDYRSDPHHRVFGESSNLRWCHLAETDDQGRLPISALEAHEANLNSARERFGSDAVGQALRFALDT